MNNIIAIIQSINQSMNNIIAIIQSINQSMNDNIIRIACSWLKANPIHNPSIGGVEKGQF